MTDSEVVLPVEYFTRRWRMSRRRFTKRQRIEGEIAMRWLRRFLERTASTVVESPTVSVADDLPDLYIRNELCLAVAVRIVRGGRRFGLPDRVETDAAAIAIPLRWHPPRVAP